MTYTPSHDPWNASADTEMRLADVMPAPKRRRTGTWIALAAAALVVAVGVGLLLATAPGRNLVAGSSSPTPSWSAIDWGKQSPAVSRIPANVQQACDLNDHMRAASDGDLTGDGATINQIASLLSTADPSLRIQSNLMKDYYTDAVAAKGGSQAFVTLAHLLGASLDLSTACLTAGWRAG